MVPHLAAAGLRREELPTTAPRVRHGRLRVDELHAALAAGPMVVMGPSCVTDLDTPSIVFACVDGSTRSELVLPLVIDLARGERLDPWLLNVAIETPSWQAASRTEVLHANYLRRLAYQYRDTGVVLNWNVLHGPQPDRAIIEHVGTAGLIALTTHGAGDRSRGLGPVATQVVRRARTPVIMLQAA